MITESRHKDTGETISEVIAMYPNELSYDADSKSTIESITILTPEGPVFAPRIR
jgi:hypothetical protein